MTLEAVVFDWGGTLSVHADVDMVDMWRLAAEHVAPEDADRVTAALVAAEAATWARVRTDQRSATLAEILAAASAEAGLDVAEAVLEEAAHRHLDSWTPHIRHDPDAIPVLSELRARGLRLGLLSNTHWPRAFHEHFLERDGLAPLLDARLYTSELARTKPHPEAFRTALDALGVTDPSRAVFVGDRLFDDVLGAARVGMRTVHRPNPLVEPHDVEPDATITRLPELLDLVAVWQE